MTEKQIDAGTRNYDHYKSTLPRWRYLIRQSLLPWIRAETPPLAQLQSLTRSTFLDIYFALVANLGTHTFFMIFLPLFFWCGLDEWGRALVNLLAFGVIVSGVMKDLLCLPRPVSPPLQRITMSGSAALEYGFPSTHTTNAVSVALYAIYALADPSSDLSSNVKLGWTFVCYVYAISIAFGRIYCGMHGFTDVIAGGALGAVLTLAQFEFGERVYEWILFGSIWRLSVFVAILLFIVRAHPEPADNCPCFDDSVAFLGVLIGINFGYWNQNQNHALIRLVSTGTTHEIVTPLGVSFTSWKTFLRIPLGVAIIVSYRAITKPLMFRVLPPLFRVLEHLDLDLPRRYFLKASEYSSVPKLRRDDNVLPSSSDVSQIFGDVRRRRGRAISVGPQSVADAYEVIAYRQEEKRRRGSSVGRETELEELKRHISATSPISQDDDKNDGKLKVPQNRNTLERDEAERTEKAEVEERRVIFSGLSHLRLRYDAEVITKLIVYAGIGWWALEGCPVVFDLLGLGP